MHLHRVDDVRRRRVLDQQRQGLSCLKEEAAPGVVAAGQESIAPPVRDVVARAFKRSLRDEAIRFLVVDWLRCGQPDGRRCPSRVSSAGRIGGDSADSSCSVTSCIARAASVSPSRRLIAMRPLGDGIVASFRSARPRRRRDEHRHCRQENEVECQAEAPHLRWFGQAVAQPVNAR